LREKPNIYNFSLLQQNPRNIIEKDYKQYEICLVLLHLKVNLSRY